MRTATSNEQTPGKEAARCLCLPLSKGSLLITLLTFIRAAFFTLVLAGLINDYVTVSKGMLEYLIIILVVGDYGFGMLGVYGFSTKNLQALEAHAYWKLASLVFLAPGISSHMLFDEKVLHHFQHEGVFIVALLFLSVIICEGWLCFQLFRYILTVMKDEEIEGSILFKEVGLASRSWLNDKEARVLCNATSMTSAVAAFCVATVLTSTVGFFAAIFFSGKGFTLGFYSSVDSPSRIVFLLIDTLGIYFGFLGLLALRRRWTAYMQQFFWYSVVKMCMLIPLVGMSFFHNNLCDLKTEGITSVELKSSKINPYPISCSHREQIFFVFVGGMTALWAYGVHLTYSLLERFQYAPLAAKMKEEAEQNKV